MVSRSAMNVPIDFQTTCWSQILRIGQADAVTYRILMEKLVRDYWSPIYAYLRRRGHEAAAAEDLTQEFFTALLAENRLQQIQREGGTFRGYLLTSVRHFAVSRHRHDRAKSRHPGTPLLPIADLEAFLLPASTPDEDAETAFEHHWARRVLDMGLERMEIQCATRGRQTAFEVFEHFLRHQLDHGTSPPRDHLAATFDLPAKKIDNFLYRGKIAFRKHLEALLAETVSSSDQVEEEMRTLYKSLKA